MSSRKGVRLAAVLAPALLITGAAAVGCLQPPVDPAGDCRRLGSCECLTRADCADGLDCADGKCQTVVWDAGPKAGETGALCATGADCNSGLCLPEGPGRPKVCTVACTLGDADDGGAGQLCPGNWDCKPSNDQVDLYLCVPPYNALCLPCAQDLDCNVQGDLCVELGGGQKVCGRDCATGGCPSGYACEDVLSDTGELRGRQCLPQSKSCECSDLNVGLGRACKQGNATGTCYGFELCQASGVFAGCDARTPEQERCSTVDDDCDGLVDHLDPSVDVSKLPASPTYPSCQLVPGGACVGSWTCQAGPSEPGWVCSAAQPREEVCNGFDEDCNGAVDEQFLDSQGRYVHLNHCSACGYDCTTAVENLLTGPGGVAAAGAVACQVRGGLPVCVPNMCAPGYAPHPPGAPVMCLKSFGSSCRPCAAQADCGPFGDRCEALAGDPGTWCLQACGADAPYEGCTGVIGQQGCCPTGYACTQRGANKLCVPQGDSCTCRPTFAGAERACLVSAGGATCLGTQVCQATGDWNACDTSMTTVELCDGADNDCDGVIDGPFIDTKNSGTYDTDAHCGACNVNCVAMWSPTIQHAIGGCVVPAGAGAPGCEIVACTQERIPGRALCLGDADCGPGRICDPLYRQCVRACGTPADCAMGEACVSGLCAMSCTLTSQCQSNFGAASTCRDGTCGVTYQFVNADKEPTNGCECPSIQGLVDAPDIHSSYPVGGAAYVDRDCDGVDGVAATALFVRAGAAGGNGSRAAPYGTIMQAVNAFTAGVHGAILVAQGSYLEQVVLKNGVKLYGGYRSDFVRRDVVTFPTLIEAPEPAFTSTTHKRGTVNAENLTVETVLAGFTIRGYDVTFQPAPGQPGKSSYAVYVKNTGSVLTVANNRIVGGRGGDSKHGAAGAAGMAGTAGGGGLNSKECLTSQCNNEAQAGGAGGVNATCPAAGGTGGAASSGNLNPQAYQSPLGKNGRGGGNALYEHSDLSQANLCKYDCRIGNAVGGVNGQSALNGDQGLSGSGGSGCAGTGGAISADEWVGVGGANGQGGTAATGGGGGGAGGVVRNNNAGTTCTVGNKVGDLGGTGGGGGAGGCGGNAGQGGGGGGGSFGVFVVFASAPASHPNIHGNVIEPGFGGAGGNGGPGGYGGTGAQGGEGGVAQLPAWCAGLGGKGGRGGNGGAGAGGGGGCGGAVFGFGGTFLTSANYGAKNTIVAPAPSHGGAAGAGGPSPAGGSAAGASGVAGTVGAVLSVPL